MEITWLGHSCFRLKGANTTVITDPFSSDLGYAPGSLSAQIVTISHQHAGHNNYRSVEGNPKIIKGPGEYETGGVLVIGLPTFHDTQKGELRGKNTVYAIEMDGVSICHLGDLGQPLTDEQIEELGNLDVLLIPVGGVSTLDGSAAAALVRKLEPKIVIPMHYKTPAISRELEPADKFLREMGVTEAAQQPKAVITQNNLPLTTQVCWLSY